MSVSDQLPNTWALLTQGAPPFGERLLAALLKDVSGTDREVDLEDLDALELTSIVEPPWSSTAKIGSRHFGTSLGTGFDIGALYISGNASDRKLDDITLAKISEAWNHNFRNDGARSLVVLIVVGGDNQFGPHVYVVGHDGGTELKIASSVLLDRVFDPKRRSNRGLPRKVALGYDLQTLAALVARLKTPAAAEEPEKTPSSGSLEARIIIAAIGCCVLVGTFASAPSCCASDGPRAESDGPQAESDGPQAESDGPQAESDGPQAESDGPQAAESDSPQADHCGATDETDADSQEETDAESETGDQEENGDCEIIVECHGFHEIQCITKIGLHRFEIETGRLTAYHHFHHRHSVIHVLIDGGGADADFYVDHHCKIHGLKTEAHVRPTGAPPPDLDCRNPPRKWAHYCEKKRRGAVVYINNF